MLLVSPQVAYENLGHLDQVDLETSANYHQMALDLIADLNISLDWRQLIADRLNAADQLLGMLAVGDRDDSY
jgi:hypothetical protein